MENEQELPENQEKPYEERPRWQVWGARLVLVIFLILLAAYYLNIARGGM